jgi:diguanylate cyclase (GGDEF)-like protein
MRHEWIEPVPPRRLLAFAGVGLGAFAGAYAFVAAQRSATTSTLETLVLLAGLAALFFAPGRSGPRVALASFAAFCTVELATGGVERGLTIEEIVLAFSLLGSLLCASALSLGVRRRDTELALAREAIVELTEGDRIARRLSGRRELTWLEAEIERARRHHHELALVLARPDAAPGLELYDDEFGETLLEAIADVIGTELRATDIALRRDGVTFSLVLPETPAEGARVAAERVRLLAPQRIATAAVAPVTLSAGVAAFPRDATTNEALIEAAEHALEAAVARGGNRTICVSGDAGFPRGWAAGQVAPGGDVAAT